LIFGASRSVLHEPNYTKQMFVGNPINTGI
jgi:hypothetical protein